jgi:hypothetical protein
LVLRALIALLMVSLVGLSAPGGAWAQIDGEREPQPGANEPAPGGLPEAPSRPLKSFFGLSGILLQIDLSDEDEDHPASPDREPVTLDQPGTLSQAWVKRNRHPLTLAEAEPAKALYLARMVDRRGGSRVPVIAPYDMTKDKTSADYHGLRMRITRNGYTLVVREPGLDIVITGSRTYFTRVVDGTVVSSPHGDYNLAFEEFDDGRGGSISFGRYGADYQIEFYCQGLKGPGQENCITKDKAEAFVATMLEAG